MYVLEIVKFYAAQYAWLQAQSAQEIMSSASFCCNQSNLSVWVHPYKIAPCQKPPSSHINTYVCGRNDCGTSIKKSFDPS